MCVQATDIRRTGRRGVSHHGNTLLVRVTRSLDVFMNDEFLSHAISACKLRMAHVSLRAASVTQFYLEMLRNQCRRYVLKLR
jgi:hypothetical protein